MPAAWPKGPEGENSQLPEPKDYAKEFGRLKQVVKKQRDSAGINKETVGQETGL